MVGPSSAPLAHQHAALNDVGLIDDDAVRTMIGPGHVPQTNSGSPLHDCDVLHTKPEPPLEVVRTVFSISCTLRKKPECGRTLSCCKAPFDEGFAPAFTLLLVRLVLNLADAQAVGDELFGSTRT